MKRTWGLGLSVALAASSLAYSPASAAPGRSTSDSDREAPLVGSSTVDPSHGHRHVPGEVVVRYEEAVPAVERAALRRTVGSVSAEPLALARTEVLEVPKGKVNEAIARLEASPRVAFAEPNFYYRAAALTPNDPRYPDEWGLHNTGQSVMGTGGTPDADIDAPEAWQATTGSSDVVVAIIDTGVDLGHPDLKTNLWTNPGEMGGGKDSNGVDDDNNGMVDDWRGWDFVDEDNNPRDLVGHGTHVAGTVGASGNDGQGVTGVAWDVSLMPLRVLDAEGGGTTASVASAISYATTKGADVINLSLEGPDFSLSVSNAIAAASTTLVVASAGNSNSNVDLSGKPSYPCSYTHVNIVCVAASDPNDRLAGYSNYGPVSVDLAAPGSSVLSTVPGFLRPLKETFETAIAGRWVAGGTGKKWTRETDAKGGYVTDSAGSNYDANSDSWLATVSPVSLVDQQNCRVSYVFSLETESNADFLDVEASSDGANWTSVGGWTGTTGGDWLSGGHDLGAFDGGPLHLRFRLRSNLLFDYDGASVDQVEVRCVTNNYSGTEYSHYSGTSMAAPHVAGVAALIYSAAPGATLAEVRSALLGGTDVIDTLVGKAVTGGRLNASGALGLVVSSAEPSPSPSSSTSPSPSPSASPTDLPIDLDHDREVRLRLRGHLRLTGRVVVPDGFDACLTSVVVKIMRWGNVVKKVETANDGTYRVRVRDRAGRYVASVARHVALGAGCAAARSAGVRHRH